MRDGIDLIRTERERQLKIWSRAHDKGHTNLELIRATTALLLIETGEITLARQLWPWEPERLEQEANRPDTHATHLRRLQKAGALIAADLDRRIR